MAWTKLWIIIMGVGVVSAAGPLTPIEGGEKPQRCSYQRAFGMLGAHCSGLNFHNVPTTLKSNILILDVSFNRIRNLRNSTFQRYQSIRYLYLGENMIQTIEAGTFEPLPNLETLDLSVNALTTIPEFIMNLPSLRRLYLTDNNLFSLNNDLKTMEKPFQAPLNFLSIAKCQLKEMPDFGMMPELVNFNISSNEFRNLSPKDFAKICGLKEVDLTNAMFSQDYCTFKILSEWFKEKDITVLPDIDAIFNSENEDAKKCTDIQFDDDVTSVYMECRAKEKTKVFQRNAKKMWLIILGVMLGCLVAFILICLWVHKQNVKKTKRKNKAAIIVDQKNAADNLLSDVS